MSIEEAVGDTKIENLAGFDWNDFFERGSEFISALSNFAWPVVILILVYVTRHKISDLISVAIRRIEAASEIEIGTVKIKGAVLSKTGDVIRGENSGTRIEPALKTDLVRRDQIYSKTKNLFLVHTIKPAEPKRLVDGFTVFDVSIYVAAHRNRGHLNDIKSITYYFGDKWGKSRYGSKYVVESANSCFALTAQMWGACWCVAEMEFHNSAKKEVLERYLDVEMAPVYGIPLAQAREGAP